MRRVVVLFVLGACAKEYGAFVEVQGDPSGIDFDKVELFFGETPSTTATLLTPGQPHGFASKLFERQVAPADVETVATPTRSLNVYVPVSPEAQRLGYVVAVASKDGMPVGIAERLDLQILPDKTIIYPVVLVPFDATEVERWGDAGDCIAWTRDRPELPDMRTVAVVRRDDHDCDALPTAMDCDDASFCAGGVCEGTAICGTSDTCAIGHCINTMGSSPTRTCEPLTCMIPGVCASNCIAAVPPEDVEERKNCGIGTSLIHTQIKMPTKSSGLLCKAPNADDQVTFQLPQGYKCDLPLIEYVDPRTTGFTYDVKDQMSGSCTVFMFPDTPTQKLDSDHHIMISFQADPAMPRFSFVVGVSPLVDPQCMAAPEVQFTGEISDCH